MNELQLRMLPSCNCSGWHKSDNNIEGLTYDDCWWRCKILLKNQQASIKFHKVDRN